MLVIILRFFESLFNLAIDIVHSVVKSLLILVLGVVAFIVIFSIGIIALLR